MSHSTSSVTAIPGRPKEWTVTVRKFGDGERRPLLIGHSGIPHFHSTLFVTTQARNAGLMPNTSRAMLDAIRILLIWAATHNIDIEKRFAASQFLTTTEIESLRNHVQALVTSQSSTRPPKTVALPHRLDGPRAKPHAPARRVNSETQYKRLSYISKYLHWLALHLNDQNPSQTPRDFNLNLHRMTKTLEKMRPLKRSRSRVTARKGLKPDSEARLLKLVATGSENNPFDPSIQKRNELIVLLGDEIGVRRGEFLTLETTDFDFQANTVLIARRHGNILDPRADQPVAKTLDRLLPISSALSDRAFEYIMQIRSQFPRAKKHRHLIVVHKKGPHQGLPLSLRGLNNVFAAIQNAAPNEFRHLTPHVLRHTKNERFAEQLDKSNIPGALAEKAQSYLSGWQYGSSTSANYTHRHIEATANKAMLELQKFTKGDSTTNG